MNDFYRIHLRSIARRRREYLGYIIATSLAVSTFFSFGFFMMHPTIYDYIKTDYASAISQLFIIGQIGVGLFAIFFVLFFQRFLLRLRGKELGLLTTLGMPPRRLGYMMCLESAIQTSAGLLIGFVVSIAQTAGLLWLMAHVLNLTQLPFVLNPWAILYGVTFFIGLFSLNLWLTARYSRKTTPKALLTSQKRSQRKLVISKFQTGLGFASLTVGYCLALGFKEWGSGISSMNVLPSAVLISVGTYLLFSQGLVLMLRYGRKYAKSGYTFLSMSRISYRMADFARILTLVSLLGAGTLTLIGIALGVITHIKQMASSTAEYQQMMQLVSLVLFVFFFIGILFFIAAVSTLYVKLFTQVDEDRAQARSLGRLGVSSGSFQGMIWRELALLVAMPVIVAIAHACVAMGEFTTKVAPAQLSQGDAWRYFAALVGGFILVFFIFYLFAGIAYGKAIRKQRM